MEGGVAVDISLEVHRRPFRDDAVEIVEDAPQAPQFAFHGSALRRQPRRVPSRTPRSSIASMTSAMEKLRTT